MAGTLQNVVGGMLEGLGKGIADSGANDRAVALKMLDQQNARQLIQDRFGFDIQEENNRAANTKTQDAANLATQGANEQSNIKAQGAQARQTEGMREGFESGQVKQYTTDANGQMVGLTGQGDEIDTGVTQGGLSKKDDDIIKQVVPQFTTKKNVLDENGKVVSSQEAIDSQGVADRLNSLGRPDLAKIYSNSTPAQTPPSFGSNAGATVGNGTPDLSTASGVQSMGTTVNPANGASPAQPQGIPVPAAYAGKADGTVLSKGGKAYVKQGNQLIPK